MSAPRFVSIREFAKLDGCNDKLVRRALSNGKLKANAEGKVDAALAGSGWRRQNRRADTGVNQGADTAQVSAPDVRTRRRRSVRTKPAPATEDELGDALDGISDEEVGDFLANLLQGKFADTGIAERIKENALAAKHLIAARRDANNVIEVERAEGIMFEAARGSQQAWLGFPTRVGPLIAADLDVEPERVVEALTIHVQQQLEQLGDPTGAFRTQQ